MAVDTIRQLCCEQIGSMLHYRHGKKMEVSVYHILLLVDLLCIEEPHSHASRAWERVLLHICTLKKIMLSLELDSTGELLRYFIVSLVEQLLC